jgi:hypothetical protein
MTNFTLRDSEVLAALAVTGLVLGGVAYALLRERPTAEELERGRRDMLVKSGRIVDGTVLDVTELTAEECKRPEGMQLILYQYEISGVVYECSQDVTLLGDYVDLYNCGIGLPASIRYAPHNPQDSIILAETWTGLRSARKTRSPKTVVVQTATPSSQHQVVK